ncbi:YhgE/Pip domain-containing protein [Corynebacterium kutscheri]|uniref:YhgE/Pip domain-containing protein n=1 Tax=Corynebacterium kutscheri TaxID=35755 RepID=UPI0037C0773F
MKNIWLIFRNDLFAIKNNVMTAVTIFGLIIIPLIFISFNVLASWNPFDNTDRLKIAVASNDAGHHSDVISMRINLGDQVLSQLSRNHDINWIITSENQAIEGTRSGEYYAAIVLPKTFSDDLLTFYLEGTQPSTLELYTNQKKNALSTTLTSRGANAVTQTIDDNFNKVVTNIGLGVISSLDRYFTDNNASQALETIHTRITTTQQRILAGSQTAYAAAGLIDSTIPLIDGADSILHTASTQTTSSPENTETNGGQGAQAVTSLADTLSQTTQSLTTALDRTSTSYQAISDQLDPLLNTSTVLSTTGSQTYRELANGVDTQIHNFQGLKVNLNNHIRTILPTTTAPGYDLVIAQLDAVINQSTMLRDSLRNTAHALETGQESADESRRNARQAIESAIAAVRNISQTYQNTLQPQLLALGESVDTLAQDIAIVRNDIQGVRSALSSNDNSPHTMLNSASTAVKRLAFNLEQQAQKFSELANTIEEASQSGDLSKLKDIANRDPETLAAQIASPVAVNRQPVFSVVSFGAGMAPLYTALALWVGALLTAVLMRSKAQSLYPDLSGTQTFFGRLLTFLLVGLAQATLVVLGLIVFIQIDAVHPLLLLLAGWVTSTVFMTIIYSLVITFGNAGKAIGVLLLVIQVSGAGGAYPLQLLPSWFQNISPWLPATHAINAFRSAIAGIYHGDIYKQLAILLLFIIPALLLGLIIRRLTEDNIKKLSTAMESTKVMAA